MLITSIFFAPFLFGAKRQFLSTDIHNASTVTIVNHVLCKHAACTSRQGDKEIQNNKRTWHFLGLTHIVASPRGGAPANANETIVQMNQGVWVAEGRSNEDWQAENLEVKQTPLQSHHHPTMGSDVWQLFLSQTEHGKLFWPILDMYSTYCTRVTNVLIHLIFIVENINRVYFYLEAV